MKLESYVVQNIITKDFLSIVNTANRRKVVGLTKDRPKIYSTYNFAKSAMLQSHFNNLVVRKVTLDISDDMC